MTEGTDRVRERVNEKKNGAHVNGSPKPESKWRIEPASAEWITTPLPPREHLLVDVRTGRGAVDAVGAWLFAGRGGAGKSYALVGLALAIASGRLWLDTFRPRRKGRVLIVAAEDRPEEDIRRRAHAIATAQGDYPLEAVGRLHTLALHGCVCSLVARTDDVFTASADTTSLCAELAAREPYDLVIVDPYGRIAGVSVDADNAAAAATINALDAIASAARGIVIGVTHTSGRARLAAASGAPEGSTAVRGATGQVDYARGVLQLEQADGVIWLSLTKANHVAPWDPVGLRRGERGELTPIDAIDLAGIKASKGPEAKAAKKEATNAERDRLDDEAAQAAIAAHPGASVRALVAVVCKVRSCGGGRAHNAVTRVRLAP